MSKRGSSAGQWVLAVIVLVAAVAGGVYLYRLALNPPTPAPVAASAPVSAASAPRPAIEHPLPAAAGAVGAAPASDGSIAGDLAALAGDADVTSLLLPDDLIAHIVATVDALPRHGMATRLLPVRAPRGPFVVDPADDALVIGARNAARYAPYVDVAENLNATALVHWYVAHYPRFQQAYRDLGYPDGYFNDRLLAVIDDLLAAPDVTGTVPLVEERMHYNFADPALQSLSVGQKMLVRSGPVNEARIKARLADIRTALLAEQAGVAP
jgi:hypothetical protein